MGYIYEELIRRFSELSNETAGEHFTPREVIRLMVNLLFVDDDELLTKPGIVKTMLDPACGTGGMLSVSEDYLRKLNPQGRLHVYGQEVNAETYATCRADMLIKGQDASRIRFGNSFDNDQHPNRRFDYLLANPPFGVEWKMVANHVKSEHKTKGFAGRFGAGTPRINDGSFLFLQHMISKMKRPEEGGARLAIVFNGSPLFTGAAGSGESEIRRWIIENDWLEAVVALPDQLFYNTGISTYFWVVTNRKSPKAARQDPTHRRPRVVDQDAQKPRQQTQADQRRPDRRTHPPLRRIRRRPQLSRSSPTRASASYASPSNAPSGSAGRSPTTPSPPSPPTRKSGNSHPLCKSYSSTSSEPTMAPFTTPRRPSKRPYGTRSSRSSARSQPRWSTRSSGAALAVRDPDAPTVTTKGKPKPDPTLRDYENVPLPAKRVTFEADTSRRLDTIEYQTAIDIYLEEEVHPYVPDAWHDPKRTKIGCEIPLTRHFYTYTPPRPLQQIDAEIKSLEAEIQALLAEVAG